MRIRRDRSNLSGLNKTKDGNIIEEDDVVGATLHEEDDTNVVIEELYEDNMVYAMTFIDRLLRSPSQLSDNYKKFIDEKRLRDLVIMWSVFYKVNDETTRAPAKRLIHKCHIKGSAEEKEFWKSAAVKVIHFLFSDNYEYDAITGMITKFDVRRFNVGLDIEFDTGMEYASAFLAEIDYERNDKTYWERVEESGIEFPADFLSERAVSDSFNKYYGKFTQENGEKRYMIRLFIPIVQDEFLETVEKSKLFSIGKETNSTVDIDALDEILEVVKPIACKKKYIKSSGSDRVCYALFVKMALGMEK